MTAVNPLLASASTLPLFQQIQPRHALPALQQVVRESRQQLDQLLQQENYTWESLMTPMQTMSARLNDLWSPIGHLNAVSNTLEWREAYNQCLPLLIEYSTEMGQNTQLYQAIQFIKQHQYPELDAVQQKIIDDELRDFELSGVALEGEDKKRYGEIQTTLSELTTKFEENILDATQHWFYHTEDKALLAGLPEHMLAFAEATAAQKELKGYVLTLDAPCYIALMKHADNGELRKVFYEAYSTRASDQGPDAGKFDNSQIMVDILALREELAQLLGFNNFAEYSLVPKMASSVKQVLDFLYDLAQRSNTFAQKDLACLKQFAKDEFQLSRLESWDVSYLAEKLSQKNYAISDELLRPYFPEDKVFNGMFEVINKIYGMNVVEVKEFEAWHKQVRFFEIYDEKKHLRGKFYADLYARPKKRGGAWMDDCRGRYVKSSGEINIPVAYLVCNFTQAVEGKPALLTHDEVTTLFHEFGHGLHHMLTQINYVGAAGINGVAWDAVELPSQFMENFCWHRESVNLFSGHFESDEPLPENLFNKMLAAKNFQSGAAMLRQLEFSLFDFILHSEPSPNSSQDIQAVLDNVRDQVAVIKPPRFNRFQHSFSHIFAGGYAAGYYSYKWAEVLSSDVFELFEEYGVLSREIGEQFLQTILSQGSAKEAMELFINFRGREPKIDALLKHSGLTHAE